MKRVIEIPKFRIEEFTSLVLEGDDIKQGVSLVYQ